ncbi:MAG: hypothetical protein GWP59_00760 [Chlamydiales bacterium]|nr:hypothetical protein [Chlamydiales bacterium]NCF70208.1 hypothetical protein [Chlamydiales bacterium]
MSSHYSHFYTKYQSLRVAEISFQNPSLTQHQTKSRLKKRKCPKGKSFQEVLEGYLKKTSS